MMNEQHDVLVTKEMYETLRDTLKSQQELMTVLKNNPSSSTPNAGQQHGINPNGTFGLFTGFGVNPRMYSTVVRARGDLRKMLPMRKTRFLQVRREIVSGVTAASGTSAADYCATPPVAGDMKVCRYDAEFGGLSFKTKVVARAALGSRYNLADQDREVVGLTRDEASKFMPDVVFDANPNSQTFREFYQTGIELERQLSMVDFQGVAGVAGGTTYSFYVSQPDGLDRIIKTGYTDVVSGNACAALDSRVVTFGANINTTSPNGLGTIVDAITDMFTGIMMDMQDMGYDFNRSQFVLVLNKRMWRPLTRVWPIAYQTTGNVVALANGATGFTTTETNRQLQDQMYNGRYLMIDGMQIPVALVDGDSQTFAPTTNTYTSSIYLDCIQLNGADTHYYEYFDMGNSEAEQFVTVGGIPPQERVINGGLYVLYRNQLNGCLEYVMQGKYRQLHDAPFLCGRIDSVSYNDSSRSRDPFPGTSYHFNGGVTQRTTAG